MRRRRFSCQAFHWIDLGGGSFLWHCVKKKGHAGPHVDVYKETWPRSPRARTRDVRKALGGPEAGK